MKTDCFIQVGVTALRDPKTGEYLPAVPIYIEKCDSSVGAQDTLIADIGKLFADRMKQYQQQCNTAGVSI